MHVVNCAILISMPGSKTPIGNFEARFGRDEVQHWYSFSADTSLKLLTN